MDRENNNLGSFICGLGVGVGVALLMAPKSGTETREQIRRKAMEGSDYLKKQGKEIQDRVVDQVEVGKKAVARGKEKVNAAVDAAGAAYRDAVASTSRSAGHGQPMAGSPWDA